jgi:hypothetical protein
MQSCCVKAEELRTAIIMGQTVSVRSASSREAKVFWFISGPFSYTNLSLVDVNR